MTSSMSITTSSSSSSSSAAIASSSNNNHHYILAQRCGGVCEGTLWQTKEKGNGSSSSSWSIFGSTPEKVYTYSILYGVRFVSYENYIAYERGDMPISIIRIVGASSTAPSTTTTTISSMLSSKKTSSATATSKYSSSSSLAMSTTTTTTTTPAIMDFRIVSDQGTHIHCQTASTKCRNNWLAAIQSALEHQLTNEDSLRLLHQQQQQHMVDIPPKLVMTNRSVTNVLIANDNADTDDSNKRMSQMSPPVIPVICQESYYRNNTNYTSSKMLLKGLSISSTKLPRYCHCCGAVEVNGMTNVLETLSMMNNNNPKTISSTSSSFNSTRSRSRSRSTSPSSKQNNGAATTTLKRNAAKKKTSNMNTIQTCSNMIVTQYVPIIQYGIENRINICTSCYIAQGLIEYLDLCNTLYEYRIQEHITLQNTSKLFWKTIYQTYINNHNINNDLSNTKKKKEKNRSDKTTSNANEEKVNDNDMDAQQSLRRPVEELTFDEYYIKRWEYSLPDNIVTSLTALMQLSIEFASYRRQSMILESLYNDYLYPRSINNNGDSSRCLSSIELLEIIDEISGCYDVNTKQYKEKYELTQLKKQAFRMAGDMGTAMKILLEILLSSSSSSHYYSQTAATSSSSSIDMNNHSIPNRNRNHDGQIDGNNHNDSSNNYYAMRKRQQQQQQSLLGSSSTSRNPYDMDMLSCVLDYLLDMCLNGEINTISFFWPQLCQIHLRMLPAKNAIELMKIDMMEDFLLTVSTKYSIHLALELTWNHIADLEESFCIASSSSSSSSSSSNNATTNTSSQTQSKKDSTGKSTTTPLSPTSNTTSTSTGNNNNMIDKSTISPWCRQRRFAVLRFLCELESLLFDEDHIRWGVARPINTTSSTKSLINRTPSSTTNRNKNNKRTIIVGSASVAVGNLLSPTQHQIELLHNASISIQSLRNDIIILSNNELLFNTTTGMSSSQSMSSTLTLFIRSIRYEQQQKRNMLPIPLQMLKQSTPSLANDESLSSSTTDQLVAMKLRIARNADYYSSHLNFTRRLTDIAEKLRFTEVEKRSNLLQYELDLLNCSGMMGGDPLNRIVPVPSSSSGGSNDNNVESSICGFIRVVRIPSTEGHVFRSKERTPVLLLVEVIDESSYIVMDNYQKDKQHRNKDFSPKGISSSASSAIEKSEISTESISLRSSDVKNNDALHQSQSVSSFYSTVSSDGDLEEDMVTLNDVDTDDVNHSDAATSTDVVLSNDNDNTQAISDGDNPPEGPLPLLDESEKNFKSIRYNPSLNGEQKTGGDDKQQQEQDEFVESKKRCESDGHQMLLLKNRNDNLYGMHNHHGDESTSSLSSSKKVITTPSRHHTRSLSDSMDLLEGASSGLSRKSPRPGALKRFDDSVPVTPKRDVEIIVNSVVEHQLHEMTIPDLSRSRSASMQQKFDSVAFQSGSTTEQVSSDSVTGTTAANVEDGTGNYSTISEPSRTKKLSTLGSIGGCMDIREGSNAVFAPTGDVRREVLTTIMMRGIQGNTIAAGAADSVQLTLKELGRKRATELLLKDDEPPTTDGTIGNYQERSDTDSTRRKMESLGLSPVNSTEEDELAARPTDEDEILEAIRLILIQNRVAQGLLTPEDAAKVLQHTALSPSNYSSPSSRSRPNATSKHNQHHSNKKTTTFDVSDYPTIDAGDVDSRLVGCGPLPPAILQAMTLWKAEMVSNAELLELVKKDIEFVKYSVLVNSDSINKLKENSAFWGRFAFGERWAEKKSRIASSSPQGSLPGWDLLGVIVKSNDDLRQEAFIMQLIELCKEAFEIAGLELWVSPYRILATGRTTGMIECVRNAMSFDSLKKRPGYGKGGLREHLLRMTEFTADPGETFKTAQRNFVRSLAAYSLLSYFFLFKDRHNGNLLLDTAGHVIHIDFGFVFGIAPGGSFSLEMSTPFKLTEEMLDVMGGLRSPLFSEFVTLFCCGFLALQSHCDTFLTIVEITCTESTFKCFEGRDPIEVVSKLRERFCPDFNKEETVSFALDLIKQATTSYGTRQYDIYQYISQGIVA